MLTARLAGISPAKMPATTNTPKAESAMVRFTSGLRKNTSSFDTISPCIFTGI